MGKKYYSGLRLGFGSPSRLRVTTLSMSRWRWPCSTRSIKRVASRYSHTIQIHVRDKLSTTTCDLTRNYYIYHTCCHICQLQPHLHRINIISIVSMNYIFSFRTTCSTKTLPSQVGPIQSLKSILTILLSRFLPILLSQRIFHDHHHSLTHPQRALTRGLLLSYNRVQKLRKHNEN